MTIIKRLRNGYDDVWAIDVLAKIRKKCEASRNISQALRRCKTRTIDENEYEDEDEYEGARLRRVLEGESNLYFVKKVQVYIHGVKAMSQY